MRTSALARCARALSPLLLALPLLTGCAARASAPVAPAPERAAIPDDGSLAELAVAAVSPDRAVAAAAIARLRAAGPAGLDALFHAHAAAVERLNDPGGPAADPEATRVREALEKVARQRDAHASRLYWYTDLEEARRAARASGKPILSLRLLGDLDDELSCANSRFFRTALYPNSAVGEALRSRFVLHWKSERPAPRVTIDFGDGRRLTRTVTGNSIHYVLDAEGRVVDALPGMYGPAAFLRGLDEAAAAHFRVAELPDDERREALRTHHAARRNALAAEWAQLIGIPLAPPPAPRTSTDTAPGADIAVPTAVPKGVIETPIVEAILPSPVVPLPDPADAAAWAALLARHEGDARLDERSRAFMRAKIATEVDLEGRALAPLDEASFQRKLAAFERAIAEDTVRNEYGMHRVIHEWLAMTPPPEDLESFNQRIYASLFLTPRSDPWLGLLVRDAYSGIQGEGVRLSASQAGRPSPGEAPPSSPRAPGGER